MTCVRCVDDDGGAAAAVVAVMVKEGAAAKRLMLSLLPSSLPPSLPLLRASRLPPTAPPSLLPTMISSVHAIMFDSLSLRLLMLPRMRAINIAFPGLGNLGPNYILKLLIEVRKREKNTTTVMAHTPFRQKSTLLLVHCTTYESSEQTELIAFTS